MQKMRQAAPEELQELRRASPWPRGRADATRKRSDVCRHFCEFLLAFRSTKSRPRIDRKDTRGNETSRTLCIVRSTCTHCGGPPWAVRAQGGKQEPCKSQAANSQDEIRRTPKTHSAAHGRAADTTGTQRHTHRHTRTDTTHRAVPNQRQAGTAHIHPP